MSKILYIKQSTDKNILYITLNRPEVLNAINLGMVEELIQAFQQAEENDDIQIIVLRGEGDKAFSSGGDLLEFHGLETKEEAIGMMRRVAELLQTIATSTKLTIAALHGYVLGGGAEITTAVDIRIASADTQLGFIQSKLGITSSWGGGSRLISILGGVRAMPLLISGEVCPADEWKQLGYIHKVFPTSTFEIDCTKYVQMLAERNTEVVRAYKKMVLGFTAVELLQKSIEEEIETAAQLWVGEDHVDAASQFFHKRQDN